jgi:dihydrofolate reductase
MIKAIVCVDKNWGIGSKNDLLFHLPLDMRHFRDLTMNKIVVCGYNTLLSFPGSKPLKGRSTIVLCPEGIDRDDCICLHSFEETLKVVKELAKTQDVMIIGGAMFYKSMLPYCDMVYVTKVDADGEAEVFFPNLDEHPDWEYCEVSQIERDGNYDIRFWKYTKKIPLELLEG